MVAAPAQDHAGADKADARQDAQRIAQHIGDAEGIRRLAGGGEKQVGLDHGDGGGKADQDGGPQAGGPAALRAVQPDDGPGANGNDQANEQIAPLRM
jgi:hypothetical protein